MRIHTYLAKDMLETALSSAGRDHGATHLDFFKLEQYGSRKRDRAFEVRLEGYGSRHRRPLMWAPRGAHPYAKAPTWDDWGWFLLEVFTLDPRAIAGNYNGLDDFHAQTEGRFNLDTADSASRQHYIETGRYLTRYEIETGKDRDVR
jgi:hypothetical protein